MEHYEGVILPQKENKKIKIIIIIAGVVIILAAVLFFTCTSYGKNLSKNISTVAIKSFDEAFLTSHENNFQTLESADQSLADSIPSPEKSSRVLKTQSIKKKTKPSSSSNAVAKPDMDNSFYKKETPSSSSVNSPSSSPVVNQILKNTSSVIQRAQSQTTYAVAISVSGDGRGIVTSSLPGIDCGMTCSWNFPAGQLIKLHATPDTASLFGGWSGACSGAVKDCTLMLGGYASVNVIFRRSNQIVQIPNAVSQPVSPISDPDPAPINDDPVVASSSETQGNPTSPAQSSGSAGAILQAHPLIVAIQIAGQSSSNDFIKIMNPSGSPIDISGWKLHKRSSTGTDYSLKEFPKGVILASGAIIIWANSSGGFSGTIGADFSTSETLSSDNSVALLDASNTIVDAVAWGNGVGQYGEGPPYPTNPGAGHVLQRISSGTVQDTDNNANDFFIQ